VKPCYTPQTLPSSKNFTPTNQKARNEMRKHPVSINLSKRILTLIDKEAEREHRKRSDWVELHFVEHFKEATQPQEVAMKLG